MAALICLASSVAFCQTNESVIREHAKDPNMLKMAAIADTMLIDKKVIADDSKKKRPRREKSHKECSRMKS
jgi:hypothetical protein